MVSVQDLGEDISMVSLWFSGGEFRDDFNIGRSRGMGELSVVDAIYTTTKFHDSSWTLT